PGQGEDDHPNEEGHHQRDEHLLGKDLVVEQVVRIERMQDGSGLECRRLLRCLLAPFARGCRGHPHPRLRCRFEEQHCLSLTSLQSAAGSPCCAGAPAGRALAAARSRWAGTGAAPDRRARATASITCCAGTGSGDRAATSAAPTVFKKITVWTRAT